MYRSFKIRSFRGFKESTIDGMTKVNLVTGLNNSGKTAVLEAFFIHSGSNNPSNFFMVDLFRGLGSRKIELGGKWFESPWRYIFNDFDTAKSIELEGTSEDTTKRKVCIREVLDSNELNIIYKRFLQAPLEKKDIDLGLSTDAHVLEIKETNGNKIFKYYFMLDRKGSRAFPIPPSMPYPTVYVHSKSLFSEDDAARYSKLQRNMKEALVFRALKTIEPRLKSLSLAFENNMNLLEGDIGKATRVPLQLMGEGMNRLASLTLAISQAENGVALIDEIENGFHYSIHSKVWQVINEAATLFNTQVIATTHSYECISAASKVFKKGRLGQFSVHRLERSGELTRSVDFDEKSLSAAIDSAYEVR